MIFNAALVFDLDGTLIDSVPQVAAAVNATLAEAARSTLPLSSIRGMIGEGAHETLARAFEATGGTANVDIAVMVERYLTHYLADPASHTAVFPGVTEVLDRFFGAGLVMGICTNKPGATTRPVLDALGLTRFFAAIVTADDTRYRKPDGRHILETLAAMKASPDRAVFVGDSEIDMAAARDARVPSVLVGYGYGRGTAGAPPATARIGSFRELPEAVAAIAALKEG